MTSESRLTKSERPIRTVPRGQKSRVEEAERTPRGAQEMAAARLAVEVSALMQCAYEEADISQSALSELLGLSAGAVSQVLNGDGNLRVATIGRYLRALGYQTRLILEPVEEGRKMLASRSTRAAIQREFQLHFRFLTTAMRQEAQVQSTPTPELGTPHTIFESDWIQVVRTSEKVDLRQSTAAITR
jgi:transcriptional regulator with XRE-family HTH domain